MAQSRENKSVGINNAKSGENIMALIKILYRSRRSVGKRPKTIEVASNLAELHALLQHLW